MKNLKSNRITLNCLILLLLASYNNAFASESNCNTKGLNIAANNVVVLFTAKWSGPDKRLMPVLDSVAQSFPEVPLHKIDVDKNPEYVKSCGIQGVPTIITFAGGQKVKSQIGVVPKEEIEQFFKSVRNKK